MQKPQTAAGYDARTTDACEQVLVTLLHGFGGFKDSVRLIGGLVPRYLTPANPPHVPAHVGTTDVDILLNVQVLAGGDAYKTLADQLKQGGFERQANAQGQRSSWRWKCQVSDYQYVVVEFLRDARDEEAGGSVHAVEGERISALAIPFAGIAHDLYDTAEVTAQTLTGRGIATETVRFANAVAFIVLKALAFDDRAEGKDAADLVHVMQYAHPSLDQLAAQYRNHLQGPHADAMAKALEALERRFCDGAGVPGHLRDGPVSHARFLHHADDEDTRVRAQRQASALVTAFIALVRG